MTAGNTPGNEMITAQHRLDIVDASIDDQLAYVGTTHSNAIDQDRLDHRHLETQVGAPPHKIIDAAFSALTKAQIPADANLFRLEACAFASSPQRASAAARYP